jgi:hypothetical protein
MLRKILSLHVGNKEDMARLEAGIVDLLGGEHHKCSFIRSEAFVKLRLRALYGRGDASSAPTVSAYWEGLKVTLTQGGTVCVYIADACVEEAPVEEEPSSLPRKRSFAAAMLEESQCCASPVAAPLSHRACQGL